MCIRDRVDEFQRPLQADMKALGYETIEQYQLLLKAVSEGLLDTGGASATGKVFEWRDVQVNCGNGACRIERRLVEVK